MTSPDTGTGRDRADIILLPPLIYLGGLVAGFVAESWIETTFGSRLLWTATGVALLSAGVMLGVAGDLAMKRGGTSPFPWKATKAIVAAGPYAWSRNPLYVAQGLMHAGIALVGDSWWALVTLLPVLILVRYGVIKPEEEYLTRKFGEDYLSYARRVNRWVGRTM